MSNSKQFWKVAKQIGGKRKEGISQEITPDQWYEHFKELFNDEVRNNFFVSPNQAQETDLCSDLNQKISEDEVYSALRKLKRGKACVPDNVLAEMLKLADNNAVTF